MSSNSPPPQGGHVKMKPQHLKAGMKYAVPNAPRKEEGGSKFPAGSNTLFNYHQAKHAAQTKPDPVISNTQHSSMAYSQSSFHSKNKLGSPK